jgi:ATP-dependent protease ClpP protease subunit
MLHQVSWELGREFAGNLVKNAQFLERLNSAMADQLVQFTGRTRAELDRDMATDFYLFGHEIIDYGLADAYWNPEELLPHPTPLKRGRLRAGATEGRKSMSPKPEPDKR